MEELNVVELKQSFASQLKKISIDCMDLIPNSSSVRVTELYEMADDFALHTIASLINYWYQSNPDFSKPLNAHLKDIQDGEKEDKEKALKRSSQKLRRINEDIREAHRKQGLCVPETYIPTSKRAGVPISAVNMQTIRNFAGIAESSSLALFRGILSGSIINWRAEQFYACYDEYDQWVSEIGGDESGDNFLPYAIDFYSCQRKLQIDLITEIADYMAAHKIKDFPTERYLGFFGTSNMYGNLIETSQVLSVRNKIPVVFLDDDKLFEIEQSKWMIMRLAQAKLTNREKNRGLCDRLTVELAANFFHYEYNLFKTHRRIGFGFPKALDLTRIRYVKKIMKEVYAYPPSKGSDIPHH